MQGIKRRIFVLAPSEDSLRVLSLFKTDVLSVCNNLRLLRSSFCKFPPLLSQKLFRILNLGLFVMY